ncbi:hypothetical protein KKF84_12815 [Myxococcota bacterium]|nr:hypothetical protein [Myxococcota bacterium]MBU1536198.1 hypothetical protein [Myxococcota bacterium]
MKKKQEELRQRILRAVVKFEQQTSAEIVVSIKSYSNEYLLPLLLPGLLMAFMFTWMMFTPVVFTVRAIVFSSLGLFFGCSFLLLIVPVIRTVFYPRSKIEKYTRREAQSEFIRLGVHKTGHRDGILVFYSKREKALIVVPDWKTEEILDAMEEKSWRQRCEDLVRREGAEAIPKVMEYLGEALATLYPHDENAKNELRDSPELE